MQYHLLGKNCSTYTSTTDLPSDFLSTPLGAALRPTIDSMFGPLPAMPAAVQQGQPAMTPPGPSLLQSISDRVTGVPDSGYSSPGPSTNAQAAATPSPLTGAIHALTNPASFRALLSSHRAVVAKFTSATCPPCMMIEPVFEELAREKAKEGEGQVAFAKVDLGIGMGSMGRSLGSAFLWCRRKCISPLYLSLTFPVAYLTGLVGWLGA